MDQKFKPTSLSSMNSMINLWDFVLGLSFYMLGAGVQNYLGKNIQPGKFLWGLVVVFLIMIARNSLNLYLSRTKQGYSFHLFDPGIVKNPEERFLSFQVGIALLICLTSVTSFVIIMVTLIGVNFMVTQIGILALLIFGLLMITVQYQQKLTGYNEIIMSFVVAMLIPAFSYLMQQVNLHRLVTFLTIPAFLLLLAQQIAISLKNYGDEMKFGSRTMLGKLGWEKGMSIHNILIASAFFILAIELLFGFPWSIAWRLLLTLPLGIFQIWQSMQIASGGKPNWRLLDLNAHAMLGIFIYLALITMWMR